MTNKYKEQIINFLNTHRYVKNSTFKPTHQSWGNFLQGVFYIDDEEIKIFMKLYTNAIENKVLDLSILELQKEYSPIIVDIDLKIPIENYLDNSRLYDESLIFNIIKKYKHVISLYLDYNKDDFSVCLFEKTKPSEIDDLVKDGFHLIFPTICATSDIRHLLRHKVVELCNQDNTFASFIDNSDIIIDKSVVSSNGWFLYGSKKPTGQLYKLTNAYDNNLVKFPLTGNIIKYLSLHWTPDKYSKNNATKIINKNEIDTEIVKLDISKKKVQNIKNVITDSKLELYTTISIFVNMFSEDRARNYEDWRNVGLALHNTDIDLLPQWIEFSSKCSEVFNESSCYKFWKQFNNNSSGNLLTIRSLAYWAKLDSPIEYNSYRMNESKKKREDSIDCSTYKVAKSFYTKYSDIYVCSSIKNNLWWEFNHHRWHRIEDGYTIRILLSEDFQNDYRQDVIDLNIKIMAISNNEDKSFLQNKIKLLNKIIEKLMNIDFKKKIMEECKTLFFDGSFDDKLDSNIHLLGFNNGIYNLESKVFRDGLPDDYVTLNTKNNYRKFSETMVYYSEINTFFLEILPNENVREYFLQALSTCLTGNTKEEKLYILTGCGSNGKSLLMDLMSLSLGDYYMACPITIITRKRGSSNEASPEKVRMKGKRCGVFQETDDGEKLNVGVMKEFTGGDPILVRDLYKGAGEMLEFKPQMKYFLTCNQLPIVPSTDEGTWRRLRVIDFISKFVDNPTKKNEVKINTKLKREIHKWGETFTSFLLYVFETKYNNKNYLKEPPEVLRSTNQYKSENDHFTEYYQNKLIITLNENDIITKEDLFGGFKYWYKQVYDYKNNLPNKGEFEKNINKIIGDPIGNKYHKIKFIENTINVEILE